MKKNIVTKMDFDILCLTENHKWRDDDALTIYSDVPPSTDSWSGISLPLSKRLAKCVMTSGNIGLRIVFCRLREERHVIYSSLEFTYHKDREQIHRKKIRTRN